MAPVQQNYSNRALGSNWKCSNNREITTAEEAQELAAMHFTACITEPDMIRRRLERLAEMAHRSQMDEAAEAQGANELRDSDQCAAPKPRQLVRPTPALQQPIWNAAS